MTGTDFAVGCALMVAAGACLMAAYVGLQLVQFRERYEQMRHEVGMMISAHQDLLADHERRLQKQGSPGQPVPTTAMLQADMDRIEGLKHAATAS